MASPRWIPLKIAQPNEICKLTKGVDNYLHNKANSGPLPGAILKIYILKNQHLEFKLEVVV